MLLHAASRPPSSESPLPGPGDLGSIALLLDVDGTILDTASTPRGVVVPDSLLSSIEDLHAKCGGALALVSGRLIRDLDVLFAPLRLPAIGGHGAEIRLSGEPSSHARHVEAMGKGLRKLIASLTTVDPRVIVEDKESSIAVHYRMAPQMEETLKTKVDGIIARLAIQDVEVMHGKAVIEIKSTHFSKGAAVCEMMKSAPFLYRRPVFIGDDKTDESVFALLPTLGGLGYSVDLYVPGANGIFGSPREVRCWLASLCGHEGNDRA